MYADTDGKVLPCCVANHTLSLGNVRQDRIEDIWNQKAYRDLRKKMLNGERSDTCTSCYNNEDNGNASFRQEANRDFEKYAYLKDVTEDNGCLPEFKLRYIDVRWSNICNFKCRSCSPTFSSSWAKENNHAKTYVFAGGKENTELYEDIKQHFPYVDTFYFAGGEPLLMQTHYDILDEIVKMNRRDVKIRYNSNLSKLKFKDKKVVDYWNKINNIVISGSLDSWGSRAEYIRDGSKWQDIEENIREINSLGDNVALSLSSVVSVFNVYTIPEFFDYLLENNLFDIDDFYPILYCIQNPSFYTFQIIPQPLKEKIIDKLESNKTRYNEHVENQINGVISFLQNSQYDNNIHRMFKAITKELDSKRSQSFCKTFPELQDIWF